MSLVEHEKSATKALRLYDNTRLSDYKRCPRFFFFRHELDWDLSPLGGKKRLPLIFGGAWHAAQEVIWQSMGNMPKGDVIKTAYMAFVEYWCQEGMPAPSEIDYDSEVEWSPRTPGRAYEMIVAYVDHRLPHAADFELIAVERPFVVPLDPDDDTLFYVGRIDKIVRRRGKILGIEHKTTSAYRKNGPFTSGFLDSFSPNAQVDGYLYALHMMYPGEVGGVWVDAALVHKQVEGYTFIPVERQLRHLDTWLWEVRYWIGEIEKNRQVLREVHDPIWSEAPYLAAFPKNTNSCWDFFAPCPYLDLCKAWPNPLGFEVPPGYEVKKWDPLDHIKGLDNLTEKVT